MSTMEFFPESHSSSSIASTQWCRGGGRLEQDFAPVWTKVDFLSGCHLTTWPQWVIFLQVIPRGLHLWRVWMGTIWPHINQYTIKCPYMCVSMTFLVYHQNRGIPLPTPSFWDSFILALVFINQFVVPNWVIPASFILLCPVLLNIINCHD